jgi:hypothetical protein
VDDISMPAENVDENKKDCPAKEGNFRLGFRGAGRMQISLAGENGGGSRSAQFLLILGSE